MSSCRATNANGNYEPGNVRWATDAQQRENKRPRKIDLCTAADILRAIRAGEEVRAIAKRHGVSGSLVRGIRAGRFWQRARALLDQSAPKEG